jgi:hypothetical protein
MGREHRIDEAGVVGGVGSTEEQPLATGEGGGINVGSELGRERESVTVASSLPSPGRVVGVENVRSVGKADWLLELDEVVRDVDALTLVGSFPKKWPRWERPFPGEDVVGLEGRDWVYDYAHPLEEGAYEKLVRVGRTKALDKWYVKSVVDGYV